ncbi:hypothetical protein MWU60_07960 [Yoonia sp. F2084L]|uniref:hypothetical protein n=1 Tax=Yoonia sp. F2084L TaxID=2926419 RepID=UPI001FF444C2|nr:hypothetical protein [Yoonia sp. F2084L]MCK0095503.1 hypothetical protein [Yoonia sp. F2084L]
MRILLSIVLACWTASATADEIDPFFPALYAVTGVAENDTLNIRAAPDGDAAVIGALAHDARDIEVITLSRQGGWALVNASENAGWAAFRFLNRQDQRVMSLGLPEGLRCFGTEPFWSITFGGGAVLDYATPGSIMRHSITSMSPAPENVSVAEFGYRFVWQSQGEDVTAHILPGRCSDGMSDRIYGLHYVDNQRPSTGCCSLN